MLKSIAKYSNGREVYIVGLTPLNIAKLTAGEPLLIEPETFMRGASYPDLFICFANTDDETLMLVAKHFSIDDGVPIKQVIGTDHLPSEGK